MKKSQNVMTKSAFMPNNKFRIWHSYSCLVALTTIDIRAITKLNFCEFTKINLNILNFLTFFSHM